MQLQRVTKHTRPTDRNERWHVIDAEGERLGRLATKVAGILQGKHRPDYSRHQLNEDFVIVVNAAKIGASGNKMTQKLYYRHSGYLGSLRTRTLDEMLARFPERVIELAVKGMLPRNRLGRRMLRRLKVYAGATHPHEAQVRIGLGKRSAAPAAPATTPSRRRRKAPAAKPEPAAEQAVPAAAEPEVTEAVAEPEVAEAAEAEVAEAEVADAAEEPVAEAKVEDAVEEPAAEAEDAVEEPAAEAEAEVAEAVEEPAAEAEPEAAEEPAAEAETVDEEPVAEAESEQKKSEGESN